MKELRGHLYLLGFSICIFFVFFILATRARASECTSIRDEDKRRECFAYERQDPNACESIHDPDQRRMCRVKAGRRPL